MTFIPDESLLTLFTEPVSHHHVAITVDAGDKSGMVATGQVTKTDHAVTTEFPEEALIAGLRGAASNHNSAVCGDSGGITLKFSTG
jgi:class 3 adenylate cyclase